MAYNKPTPPTDADSGESSKEGTPPSYDDSAREAQWQRALLDVQETVVAWQRATAAGDSARAAELSAKIPQMWRNAGDIHPDPEVRARMYANADQWEHAGEGEKTEHANAFLVGIGAIIATPFVLVGAALVGAGAVVWGAAKVLQGIGEGLSAGPEYLWNKWRKRPKN